MTPTAATTRGVWSDNPGTPATVLPKTPGTSTGRLMGRGWRGDPNIAFSLSTQCGYDSDHPMAKGEVGKAGVAIDTLRDFEVVIEHHLDVMKNADWIIDLGPGAGDQGGYVVATGTPEEIARHESSATGHYLIRALDPEKRYAVIGS